MERHPIHHPNNPLAWPPKWFRRFLHRADVCPNKTPLPNHFCHPARVFETRNQAAKTASLDRPQCKPSDEMLLHQKEHKDGRDCGDNAASTHHVIGSAILTVKGRDARGDGLRIGSLGQDDRPEIVVPNKGENQHG